VSISAASRIAFGGQSVETGVGVMTSAKPIAAPR
jgi:hypothetical protein